MKKIKRAAQKFLRFVVDTAMGNGLMQEENIAAGDRKVTPGMPELLRRAAGEGIVLLENDGILPLKDQKVAVFGRCQLDWFYVGYGSGGDVHPPYRVNLMEGLANAGVACVDVLAKNYRKWCEENPVDHGWWGHWPYFYPEMPLEDAAVRTAAEETNTALLVIGRAAGEDRENILAPGGYYLTEAEKHLLKQVTGAFEKVVLVMNCGQLMDLGFLEEYPLSAVVFAWQLGQESGNAVADVLTGKVCPSGRLTDTVAKDYWDYPSSRNFGNREFNNYAEDIFVGYRYFETFCPEKVRYPFGYGLSYTEFSTECVDCRTQKDGVALSVKVKNIGGVSGKEVVQVYCQSPAGKLPKAKVVLVGYEKTDLLAPGEEQTLHLFVSNRDCACFDEKESAFLLEKGTYRLYLGKNCRDLQPAGKFTEESDRCLLRCGSVCMPEKDFAILPEGKVIGKKGDLAKRILENLPEEIPYTGDRGITLPDVAVGRASLDDFIAQLSLRELADLTRGQGAMDSPLGYPGNAGAFGGITEQLRQRGIPAVITADGPSGLRLRTFTSLLPCGTAIACAWNKALTEELFRAEGREVRSFGVDVLLGPGMNLHRNVLCGRNFEYYSEDPYLTGHTAAAAVRGLQKGGVSACPKHFACNNQEVNRNRNDSRVSPRALRELYLRSFEICVREGKPQHLMTGYNKLNGVWCHYHYDLVTAILRQEWGYEGNVVTDWWMRKAKMPEFPRIKDNAYRVRAQVDVLMPGNMNYLKTYCRDRKILRSVGKPGGLTRGEIQRSAKNVLGVCVRKLREAPVAVKE